jgi:thiol:disulfide interchange protein DsbC
MLRYFITLFLALFVVVPVISKAQSPEEALRARLSALVPDLQRASIKASPIEGVYEVKYGTEIVYVSADGRYLVRGDLYDLKLRRNLTEAKLNKARAKIINKVDEQQMIVFSPRRPEHTITVFTDIDCEYCRMLHAQISQYLQEGIKVRYMAFPRTGLNTPSYDKAVDVWCADNRRVALTRAKRGQPVTQRTCNNPVKQQMALGRRIGVSVTPAILLKDGEMLPGYRPAKALNAMLDTRG